MLESDTCTADSDDEVIEGNFVIVKVEGKSREVQYIVQVDTIDGDEFEGTFLKKSVSNCGICSSRPIYN